MKHPFLERLERGPILCDGAMGTMLYARGIPFTRSFDELNLSQPELVQSVHRDYIAAGAEIIETNTFGANRFRLAPHNLEDQVRVINLRGAKIAREAREIAGVPIFVAGSVGPIGRTLAPLGQVAPEDAKAAFKEQMGVLLEGGVDLFIVETFSDLAEIKLAVAAAQELSELPIVAQMSFSEDGETVNGQSPEDVVRELSALGVTVIGANCCVGPAATYGVLQHMRSATDGMLSAQPNAGYPALVQGRFIYYSTPAYFADYTRQFLDLGTTIIGGCCGTTPEHIALAAAALRESREGVAGPRITVVSQPVPEEEAPAAGFAAQPTTLRGKLQRGQFVISVEIDPPKGLNPAKALDGATLLKAAGADCINVADSPIGRVRMSSIGMAHLIQQMAGVETIVHVTTRDRNLMGLQSDLLGAYAVGIRNVLALMGDPPRTGDYPNAKAVFDVDAVGLITILRCFNEGKDMSGGSIGAPADFFIGCATDLALSLNIPKVVDRLRQKLDAGAGFVMTQPIFDIGILTEYLSRFAPFDKPFLLGVLPLQSSRHAEFLHNEVPGITIPAAVRERMRKAGEHGQSEGLLIAQELLAEARSLVQGTYIMPSFGRYEVSAELVKSLKEFF